MHIKNKVIVLAFRMNVWAAIKFKFTALQWKS